MKKIFLLLCLIAISSFAGTVHWTAADSAVDKHLDNVLNWHPSGSLPASTDTVIFGDSTMTQSNTPNQNVNCAKLVLRSNYQYIGSTTILLSSGNYVPLDLASGYTITGGNGVVFNVNGGDFNKMIPAITVNGDISVNAGNGGNHTINFDQTISTGGFNISTWDNVAKADSFLFTGDTVTASYCQWGSQASVKKAVFEFDGSVFNFGRWLGGTYNQTSNYYNFRNATINVTSNDWTYGTNGNVDEGTARWNFTNTITITSNGKKFHDVNFNGSGKTFSLYDSLVASGDITVSAGTFDSKAKRLRCVDFTLAGTSTFTGTGSNIHISGNLAAGNSATFTKGTSRIILSAGTSHTWAAGTGNQRFDSVFAEGSVVHSGSDSMRLYMSPGLKLSGTGTLALLSYDLEGSAGSLDSLDGVTIDIPADDSLDYVYFKNVTLAAADSIWVGVNGIDGGGNSGNIIFPVLDTVPIISGISPDSVYFGDSVTISGSIFGANPTLLVDGGVVPTISASATEIVFRVTDLSYGLKTVVVRNNEYTTYDTTALFYKQIVLDSIRPIRGIAGDTLSVYGIFVASEPSVRIGDSVVGTYISRTDSLVIFRAVSGYVGTVNVSVFRGGLGFADTVSFDYDTIPIMVSNTTDHGKTAGGEKDTVTFDFASVIDSVLYGGVKATITGGTATKKYITVPAHAVGTVSIISYARYGYKDTLPAAYTYDNIYGARVLPAKVRAGDTVTLSAEYGLKTSGLLVSVGDSSAVVLAGYADTLAQFIAPAYLFGLYDVFIENSAGDLDTIRGGLNYKKGAGRFRFGFGFGF